MEITHYFSEMREVRSVKSLSVHKLVLELFPESKVSFKYLMPLMSQKMAGLLLVIKRTIGLFIAVGLKNSQNV